MSNKRRTQAERRAETYKQVLDSACRLFGDRGYNNTSLEDIAADCDVTTRPIYHYFGNKKALFSAVNEAMEERIIEAMDYTSPGRNILSNWQAFLSVCDDPGFRRIVLIDSPNVLGRERWAQSDVSVKAMSIFHREPHADLRSQYHAELMSRMMMGAFAEAALVIAEADDVELAKQEASKLVTALFG